MKRSLGSLLVLSFVLWILPLGNFIKPSQQRLACDGQRAICMCHALVFKAVDKAMEVGMGLKTGSSANKEKSSGGSGNYFVAARSIIATNGQPGSTNENQFFLYKSPF